jgi:hypothetical protein
MNRNDKVKLLNDIKLGRRSPNEIGYRFEFLYYHCYEDIPDIYFDKDGNPLTENECDQHQASLKNVWHVINLIGMCGPAHEEILPREIEKRGQNYFVDRKESTENEYNKWQKINEIINAGPPTQKLDAKDHWHFIKTKKA